VKEIELEPHDPDFPSQLQGLDPPLLSLRVRGALPDLERAVAIVGTRAADDEARQFTERLAFELASAGCPIVSGGALGIDGAAHVGALNAGRPTIAVLASGFSPPYPRRHGPLFERIVEGGGALVTEVPDGTAPQKGRFLARNRIVAAMARVVVVTQAPIPSGALSTAALAVKRKTPVMSVPSAPWDPRGEGCLVLLKRGALVCTSARDVLSVSATSGGASANCNAEGSENNNDFSDLDPVERQIVRDLGPQPRHPDEIAHRTGLAAREVQRALSTLLLKDLIEVRPGGRFRRRSPRL
jgi:DNA processing protein